MNAKIKSWTSRQSHKLIALHVAVFFSLSDFIDVALADLSCRQNCSFFMFRCTFFASEQINRNFARGRAYKTATDSNKKNAPLKGVGMGLDCELYDCVYEETFIETGLEHVGF